MPIDPSRLAEITGGANAPAAAGFNARWAQWLKLTEGKSAVQLLQLPGPPRFTGPG